MTPLTRRRFLASTTLLTGGIASGLAGRRAGGANSPSPTGPLPVAAPHYPSRLHAFVWRNWSLVPLDRLVAVLGATPAEIIALAQRMGLEERPRTTPDQQRRSYLTVIRRNWHLLPDEQLLTLLGWTPEHLAFTLREDDFLYLKLGSLKPRCEPLRFEASDEKTRERESAIAELMRHEFPGSGEKTEPLFSFVEQLSATPVDQAPPRSSDQLRLGYSYFALYGDPFLETETDPFPDGYLARLAASGVNAVWLQAVLHKLAPCPWQPDRSARFEDRLQNVRLLVARARQHGIALYLYLNEPRALPALFFQEHPALRGAAEGDYAALCTSHPDVRKFLRSSVASLCRAVPDLGGFFSITASENLTNCWSHGKGAECPRCRERSPAQVIAEVNATFAGGINDAEGKQRLIAWDWGWDDAWAPDAIAALPAGTSLMSVSEWSLPIERGGVKSVVGEYSISAVGPGPRALRHWELARARGLPVLAKIQAANTWELSAVPYIPALHLVAEHAVRLREARVDGLMLGWTLGGYPSPNLEVVSEVLAGGELASVAHRRYGESADAVMRAWHACSESFREFPYHIGVVYQAPFQLGPANLLWEKPTGYSATMVGFPYDDLKKWRDIYPTGIFVAQLEKVSSGFEEAAGALQAALGDSPDHSPARIEARLMEACAIHWQSAANQSRFVAARDALATMTKADEAATHTAELRRVLENELTLAHRLHTLQSHDSRLGFEASNHYYYVPLDLVEKVLNCRDLLDRWLPGVAARLAAN